MRTDLGAQGPVRLPMQFGGEPKPWWRGFWDMERDIHHAWPVRGTSRAHDARVCCGDSPAWTPPTRKRSPRP